MTARFGVSRISEGQGVRLFLHVWIVLAMAACRTSPAATTEPGSGAGSITDPEVAQTEATGVEQPASEPADANGDPAVVNDPDPEPAVDLAVLLTRAGFVAQGELQVDEFVPVPPGATATAATFGRGDWTARAVLVRYPNPQYARPHVTDVLERRALVPDSGDAVLARANTVLQLRLGSRTQADALVEELRVLLQWEHAVDPALLPRAVPPSQP